MKKIVMMSAGLLICSGIVLANQYGVKSLNFGAPTVKDVDQVADARDGDIVYQKPDSGPKTPGFWGRINGAWIELVGSSTATPAGIISAFGGVSTPAGYLLCDGTSYNAIDYPELAAALWDALTGKYAYGGTGTYPTGTFNVPDLRGRFLRGVTGGNSNDPEASTRGVMNTGGNNGNRVGSVQGESILAHSHGIGASNLGAFAAWDNNAGRVIDGRSGGYVPTMATVYTNNSGGLETRPKNAYVNFIIKY